MKRNPYLRAAAAAGLAAVCVACASGVGSTGTGGVHVSDAAGVQGCTYLGDVHGTSPFYGMFAGMALDGARKAALATAAKMGASHVVWKGTKSEAYSGTMADGDAYKCGS